MKYVKIAILLGILINFIVNNLASMSLEREDKREDISNILKEQFINACKNRSKKSWINFGNKDKLDCMHVFITPKFRIEYKRINNEDILETNISFKREYLGMIKNNLPVADQTIRSFILNLIEVSKSSEQSFGYVSLDKRTFCSGPIYPANGNRGVIKCQTLLRKM